MIQRMRRPFEFDQQGQTAEVLIQQQVRALESRGTLVLAVQRVLHGSFGPLVGAEEGVSCAQDP